MIADILDIEKNLFSDEAFNNLKIIERDDLVYIIYTYTYDDEGTIRNTLYIRSISKDKLNSKIILDIDIDNINYFKDEFNVEIFINQSVSERVYEDYKLYDNYILNEVEDMFYITYLDVELGVQTIAFETNSYLEDNVFVRYKYMTNESLFSTIAEYDITDVDTMYATRLLDVYFYKINKLYYYDLIYISDGEIFQELSKNVSFIKQTRLYDVIVDNGYTIDTTVGYNASINFQSKVNLIPGDNLLINGIFSEIKLAQITDNGNTSYTYDILFVDSKQISREKISQIIRYRNDFIEKEVDGYYSMMIEEPKLIYVDENDIFGRDNNDYELISYSMSDSKALLINYFYNIPTLKESYTMLCYNKYVMYTTTNDVFDENGLINFNTKIESFININVDESDNEVYTNLFKDSVWVNETEIMSYGFTDSGSETYSISKINFGLGVLEEKVEGIPSVSGFDFDGFTSVGAYTTAIIDTTNFSISLDIKLDDNSLSSANMLFYNQNTFDVNGQMFILTIPNGRSKYSIQFYLYNLNFIINYDDFIPNEFNKILINIESLNSSTINVTLYCNGYVVDSITHDSTDFYTSYIFGNDRFGIGNDGDNSGFTNGIIRSLYVRNDAVTEQEAIDITSGDFNNTDSRIVFYESFNNTTKGIVTGTEQYTSLQEGLLEHYLIEKAKQTNLSTSVPISNTIKLSDFENIKTLYDVNRQLMIFIEDTDFQFFDVEETGLTIGTADNYYTNINTDISNSETYITFKNSEKEYRLVKYKTVKDKYLNDGMILTKMLPLLPEYLQTNTKTQTIIDTLEQIQNANIQYSNYYYDSFETPILLGAYINNSSDDWMVNLLEINPNLYFFDSSNSYGMNPVLSTMNTFAENNSMLQIDDKYLIDMIKNNGLEYLYDIDYFQDLINIPFYEDTNGDFLDLTINSDRSRDVLYNSNEINDYKNNLVYKSSQIDDEIRNIFNIIAKYSKYNSSKFFLELIVGLFSFNYSLKLSIKTNKNMIDINDLSVLGKIVDNKLYFYYDNDILEQNMSGLTRSITFIEKIIQNFIPINFIYDGLLVKVNIQDEMNKKSFVEETAIISNTIDMTINDTIYVNDIVTTLPSEDYNNDFVFGTRGSGVNKFYHPEGISVYEDKIYITDCNNNRIVITDLDGSNFTSFGSFGSGVNEFYHPNGISVYEDKIYIADCGNSRVVITDLDGSNFTSFGSLGSGVNQFTYPKGISVYEDKIYITDSNSRVVITDLDGSNFTSFESLGSGVNEFYHPEGISVYEDKIYITDYGNNRIVITDLDGSNFTSFGSFGSGVNQFNSPNGISVYEDKIYIADYGNNRIVITDLDGSNFTSFGSLGSGVNEFNYPHGISIYEDKIYITNSGNSKVVVWNTPSIISENDGYILTITSQSQDDELYKYYNNQWNQLYPQINDKVLNLSDDNFYKYITVGDNDLFVRQITDVNEVLDIVTTIPTDEVGFNEAYIYRATSDHDMLSVYNGVSWYSYYSYIGKQVLNITTGQTLTYTNTGTYRQFV